MFIKQLERLCAKRGMSVTAYIENVLHMSKGNLGSWNSGGHPSVKVLKKISDDFGVTTDYLLTGKEPNNIKIYDEEDNPVVFDDETRNLIDSLRKRPELKLLFSVSKNATKEDIINTVKIIEALKDKKEGE